MSDFTRRQFVKRTAQSAMAFSLGAAACTGVAAGSGALFLTGCTAGGEGQDAETAGEDDAAQVVTSSPASGSLNTVIVALPTSCEPAAGFDPLVAWGCGEHVHEPLIQSTLLTTTADMGFQNDLAISFKCENDGMTWTFVIRDDVKFSDGEPLRASDVAFTINSIVSSDTAECDLSMVREAVATDDTTVVISMNKPFNALLYTLATVGIVPEHAYDSSYGTNPIGSGRYLLEQWNQGQQAIFKANPDYYGSAPLMERVVVLFVEEDAALATIQASQADIAYTSATFVESVPVGFDLLSCTSVDSRGISLPCVPSGNTKTEQGDMAYEAGNDVTSDIAVRRALNYGVDRQTLVEHVFSGYATPAYSVCDSMPWATDAMVCETDVELAKTLLDEAGWAMGDDGIRVKEGTRASFSLYYSAGDSVRQAIASDFALQMEELGIEVNVIGASWDDIYVHQYSDPVLWGWGSNSPIELYNLSYSSGGGNYASYENATVDAYMDAALAQSSIEASYEYWQLAQWDGSEGINPAGGASWVWLANVDHLYFVHPALKVATQKPHPHGHGWSLLNNVDRWSWA